RGVVIRAVVDDEDLVRHLDHPAEHAQHHAEVDALIADRQQDRKARALARGHTRQVLRNETMLSHTVATSSSVIVNADGSHRAFGATRVATGNSLSSRR